MNNGINGRALSVRAHDPFFWLKQAKELDHAAMLIWAAMREDLTRLSRAAIGVSIHIKDVPSANLGGVFWLNAGLALENLLKGIIIQDHPESVVNGTIIRALRTHNLLKLAKRASVSLDSVDAFFLSVGTECVEWAGRYPCSTKPAKTAPPVFSEADVMAYRGLFTRLCGRLTACDSKTVSWVRVV